MSNESQTDRVVSIGLPEKYWVILLATLEHHIQTHSAPALQELKKQGEVYKKLPPEKVTILVGPIIARGMIVKELAKAGVMTKEADESFGVDQLMEAAKKFMPKED